jgi:hypothetical protein
MKEPKPSLTQVDYTKRSYYVGIIAVIVAVAGIYVSYHLGQQSKSIVVSPTVESQKLVSQQESVNHTSVPPPAIVVPSPTPTVETKRKPTKQVKPLQKPGDGRCYLTDEHGNYEADEEGYRIEVDCETGENIDP